MHLSTAWNWFVTTCDAYVRLPSMDKFGSFFPALHETGATVTSLGSLRRDPDVLLLYAAAYSIFSRASCRQKLTLKGPDVERKRRRERDGCVHLTKWRVGQANEYSLDHSSDWMICTALCKVPTFRSSCWVQTRLILRYILPVVYSGGTNQIGSLIC